MQPDIDFSRMVGLTHTPNGKAVTRQVRMLKVGIGYPRGPAIHVYIDAAKKWTVELGVGKEAKREKFDNRVAAEKFYREQRPKAKDRTYPGKLPYFTFHRIGMDGGYYPDFDAIEQHGSMPVEIGVVFLVNTPLDQRWQVWTTAELKCEGNGVNARRRVTWAKGEAEERLAAQAAKTGEKFFVLQNGCYSKGCPFPRDEKRTCKPHSTLSFQLTESPMLGGTCTFDSTGYRSGVNLFSCLEQIRSITGRGNPEDGTVAGIPLRMMLRPYRTSFDGKPATQFGVSLSLRASDAVELHRKVIAAADEFRQVTGSPLLLEAGGATIAEYEPLPEAAEARMMADEFYPQNDGEEIDPGDMGEGDWEELLGNQGPQMPQRASAATNQGFTQEEMDRDLQEQLKREQAEENGGKPARHTKR